MHQFGKAISQSEYVANAMNKDDIGTIRFRQDRDTKRLIQDLDLTFSEGV